MKTNVPTRWVEFSGIDNVRDLGGLPVAGNRRTRFGLAYRSSTLQELTDADLGAFLGPIGLNTIIDLRLPHEARREGHGRLADTSVCRINLPVRKTDANPSDVVPDSREVDLAGLYRDLLAGSPGSVVSAARIIADAGRHAVVFHCAAGKDRTGVLAAVVLDAVGVPADAIVEDYALSGQRLDRVRQRLVKLPSYRGLPPVRTGYLGVEAVVMRRFLTTLRAEFGGGAQWLLQHGFGAAELRGLRDTLVEPV